jgi:predicted RNA-binding Zn-ribbon protein involved in translation (DUF1610 family)
MALTITCPSCRTNLRVREEYVGRQMICPRCQASVPVSAEEQPLTVEPADAAVPPSPAAPAGGTPTKACPACGQQIAYTARKCRFCRTWIEEEEDDDELGRSYYKPCPRCGRSGAKRVIFTFWGSFYGPALLTHVRCPSCGTAYNGRTGRSNLLWAIVFVTVPLLLILLIVGGLIAIIVKTASGS